MDSKRCHKCEIKRPITDYCKGNGKDGLRTWCRLCMNEWARNNRRGLGKPKTKQTLEEKRRYAKVHTRRRWLDKRFYMAVRQALKKDFAWTLTEIEYHSLMEKPCYYHGGRLNDTGIGLDRLDNSFGYHIDNVVPCCGYCNSIRRNVFTPNEMLKIGKVVNEILTARGELEERKARLVMLRGGKGDVY